MIDPTAMLMAMATGISTSVEVEKSRERRAAMTSRAAKRTRPARYANWSGSTQAVPASTSSGVHGLKSHVRLSMSLSLGLLGAQLATFGDAAASDPTRSMNLSKNDSTSAWTAMS